MKDVIASAKNKKVLAALGVTLLCLIAFQAGSAFGFHRAIVAFKYDDRFDGRYGMHSKRGPFGDPGERLPGAHGTAGRVLSVDMPTVLIEDRDMERIVRFATGTEIREGRERAESGAISVDDFIVVIGNPNDKGEVEAKFVRILPPPKEATSSNRSRI